MANCDTCAAETSWEIGTAYIPEEFRELVRRGYIAEDTIKAFPVYYSRERAIAQWKDGLVGQSTTPWLPCPRCAREAGRFMDKRAGTGPPPGVPMTESITPEMLTLQKPDKSGRMGVLLINALVLIGILMFAVLESACHQAEKPSDNSSTSSPAGSSASSGDFEGIIAMKMENEVQNGMEMTYFLKGRHTRIETKALGVPEAQSIMLWDMEGGKIMTLMPARKTYMTIDMKAAAEEMKGMAEDMKKSRGENDDAKFPKLTPTGKQETIAGYTCEHWLMGEKQEMDICVAKGLGYFGMGGQSGSGDFSAFKNFSFSPKLLDEAASHPEWVKFLEGGAFPLKLQVVDEGKVKMSMEATRVERKVLDDSLFAIPADYKEMTIPTMPAGRQ